MARRRIVIVGTSFAGHTAEAHWAKVAFETCLLWPRRHAHV